MQYSRIVAGVIVGVLVAIAPVRSVGQPAGADTIWLGNPSFEDIPRAGGGFLLPIRGWVDCGESKFPDESPPDIHPASAWAVTRGPHDGATYLGMVVRDNESWESVSQAMSGTLEGGQCYAFEVWLCQSDTYLSRRSQGGDSLYPFTEPAVLRIFGGRGFCDEGELLAESTPVTTGNWTQFAFKFEPVRDHRYITLQAFYKTPVLIPYNGHILVDGMSPIIPIPCTLDDPTKIFEEPEPKIVTQPENTSPPVAGNSGNRTNTRPPPAATPPVPKVTEEDNGTNILTELDRHKLHQGKTIRIERLYFKADSSRIEEESNIVLDEIARFLLRNPDIGIEIGGHTNTLPDDAYCNKLSTDRAKSVTEYLISKGVPRRQLQYKGYGKSKPIIPDDQYSRAAQSKNQRVEIKVLSLG